MFRTVSIIGFIATFAAICLSCIASPCTRCRWSPGEILRTVIRLFTLLLLEQKLSPVGILRKLVYLLAVICFLVLAVTGFYPPLFLKQHIHGYWLMLHATFAPVFAVCLAVLAILSARHNRFNCNDWPWLQRITERLTLVKSCTEQTSTEGPALLQKIAFWIIIALALPLILSVISSMFPLFGTPGQRLLANLHRWTTLTFALVAIIHTYLIIRTKMKH